MDTLLGKYPGAKYFTYFRGCPAAQRGSALLEAGVTRAVAGFQPFPRSKFRRVFFNLTEVRLPVFDLAILFSPFGGQVFQ
jgi:hypothetical protein